MRAHDLPASENEQGQRISWPPNGGVLDDIVNMGSPGGNSADRSDMFGIERMLHCKQIAHFIIPNIAAKG